MFSPEIFNKSIEWGITFGEDWITNLLVADNVEKILCIEDVVYNYYNNISSITHQNVFSYTYIERVENLLNNMKILNRDYLEEEVKVWYSLNRLKRFFIPELGFRYKDYIRVRQIISEKKNRDMLFSKVDSRFMRFFYCMPFYYIYTKVYNLLFLCFKLKWKRRKVVD